MMTNLTTLLSKQEELHPDLRAHVQVRDGLGSVLHSPLIIHVFYTPEMNALINHQYAVARERRDAAREACNWDTYVFAHERPYRVEAFAQVFFEVPVPQRWSLMAQVWIDSEEPGINKDLWRRWFEAAHGACMDEEDLAAYAQLPEEVTIYRGTTKRERKPGLSWTLDKEKARWFAKRWSRPSKKPRVLTATVRREQIAALFTGRNEQEVIVLSPSGVIEEML